MKNQSGCVKLSVVLFLLLSALGLVGIAAWIFVDYNARQKEQRRAEFAPPVVRITSPEDGLDAAVGSHLPVAGTVFFSPQTPVTNIEWWLDGTRLESQSIQLGMEESLFYAHYDLLVPTEGNHLLFLRAINSLGVIGNSQPITFQGTAKGDAYSNVTVAEGETLESLAANYRTDTATLQNLNPGLGSAPTAGTTVKVPLPPENEPAAPAPTPMASSVVPLVPTAPMLQVSETSPLLVSFFASAPPQAPTDLQGEVKDCKVKLIWQDNASNESGYEIWMAAGGSALTRLAQLQPASGGAAWFEFQAPGPGYFLFWVEAVNPIGAQGSNIIYLDVDAGCPAGAPTHLQAEILDITVNAAADRIYCYVSFENAPEARLPEGDGNFITVQNGHGDLVSWPHTFAVPFPQDGTLDISGECWGWLGNTLGKLGNFAVSSGSETWNGSPILAHGSAFDVSLSLTPVSQPASDVRYTTSNDQPAPYNLRFEREEGKNWVLRWDFNPAPKSDADYRFMIQWYDLKDPKERRWIKHDLSGTERSFIVLPEAEEWDLYNLFGCEKDINFVIKAGQVGGGGGEGTLTFTVPKCETWLTVTFDTLELPWTGDGWDAGPCDEIEVYYTLMVNDQIKNFWGGCSFNVACWTLPLKCGTYTFKELAPTNYPYPDRITVSIYGEKISLQITTWFYDLDDNPDDLFAAYDIKHEWPTRAAAEAELGCNGKSFATDMYVNDTADSILHYTISVFPNSCQSYQP